MKCINKSYYFVRLILINCVFFFLLNSCVMNSNYQIEKILEDGWIIDTILYQDAFKQNCYDMMYCMGVNVVQFEKNNQFVVYGLVNCENMLHWSENGTWKIIQNKGERPYSLSIESENEVFGGIHQLWFYKDREKKLLKMVLFSDHLYLVASKPNFNYEQNMALMNSLVKATEKRGGRVP